MSEQEMKMSPEETIELIKGLCVNFSHPSFEGDVTKALADVADFEKDPEVSREDVLFAYYSTLGQIVTRSSIIQAMDQFSAEVDARVKTGVAPEDAVKAVMMESGLPGIVEVPEQATND